MEAEVPLNIRRKAIVQGVDYGGPHVCDLFERRLIIDNKALMH